jgi:hypothetical protein
MPRRGARRIPVIGVGTPPTLTREMLRPLAMGILHRWDVKQAAEHQAERDRKEGHLAENWRAPEGS